MSSTPRTRSIKQRLAAAWPLGLCLALFVLLVILVNPLHDFPMGDDWEYARSVQRLLTTGQFYRSPVVQATVLFPALWGGLFARLFGFSFTILRLSTLPLGAGCLAAFYGILGELGFDRSRRLLGTLAFMVTPLFVFNALSFMTDVPFLFWLLLGLWCALRAFRLQRAAWLVAASACSALAFLTRQLGLAQAVALALAVLIFQPRSAWPRWLAAALVVPLAAAVLFFAWQAVAGQTTWADSTITGEGTLQFIFSAQLPAALARRVILLSVTLCLYMTPLWLAFAPGARRAWQTLARQNRWLLAAEAVLGLFVLASVTFFGTRGEWWPYFRGALTNAGLWPTLAYFTFPGDLRPPFLPRPVWIGMTYLGAGLAVVFALGLISRLLGALRAPLTTTVIDGSAPQPHWAARLLGRLWARLQALGPARGVTYLTFLGVLSLVLVYTLFVERYFLPLLPGAILLFLETTRDARPSPTLAGAGLLLVGLLSVGLMWDYFDWHAARWNGAQALVAAGVPLEQLDAGYEWNGWYLSDEAYAYIQARGVPLIDDPFAYVIDPQYMVTFGPWPGYTVAQVWPFYSPFRSNGADHLLLLKRDTAP
jgi:hypothetical protein